MEKGCKSSTMINKLIIPVIIVLITSLSNCHSVDKKDPVFIFDRDSNNISRDLKIRLNDSVEIGKLYDFSVVKGQLTSQYKLYDNYKDRNYRFCLKSGLMSVYVNAVEQKEKMKDSVYLVYCDKEVVYNGIYPANTDSLLLSIYKELKTKNIDIDPELLDKELNDLQMKLQEDSNRINRDSLAKELVKKIIFKFKQEVDKIQNK